METLPEEDSYEPYKQTRKFYYDNGFVRIAYKKARLGAGTTKWSWKRDCKGQLTYCIRPRTKAHVLYRR